MKSFLSRILFSIACRFLRWSQALDADYGYDDESSLPEPQRPDPGEWSL